MLKKYLSRFDHYLEQFKKFSPLILRFGISIVFLWFGISQLINPESFVGYVPQWIESHAPQMLHDHALQWAHNIPKPATHLLIMGNGLIETVFGLLLLFGIFTRLSSFILAIHLSVITIGLGYNDIAVRDFGLIIATLAIFFHGSDKWCLDKKRKK